MTTPSGMKVIGVLVDSAFLCQHIVPSGKTVDSTLPRLWRTLNNQVEEDLTSKPGLGGLDVRFSSTWLLRILQLGRVESMVLPDGTMC